MLGTETMNWLTRVLNVVSRRVIDEPFWQWSAGMPEPRRGPLPARSSQNAEAVYFPACLSPIMGVLPDEQKESDICTHCSELRTEQV